MESKSPFLQGLGLQSPFWFFPLPLSAICLLLLFSVRPITPRSRKGLGTSPVNSGGLWQGVLGYARALELRGLRWDLGSGPLMRLGVCYQMFVRQCPGLPIRANSSMDRNAYKHLPGP